MKLSGFHFLLLIWNLPSRFGYLALHAEFFCVHLKIHFKIKGKWSHLSKLTWFTDMYSTQLVGNSKPGSPHCRNDSFNFLWRSEKRGWNKEFSPQVGNWWEMGVWFFIMTRVRKIHSENMATTLLHKGYIQYSCQPRSVGFQIDN